MGKSIVFSFLVLFVGITQSAAQQFMNQLYGADGQINAIDIVGSTAYIGGAFTHIGLPTGQGAMVDGIQGNAIWQFPRMNGFGDAVSAFVPDGSGGWFIGGLFPRCSGLNSPNLAHVRADFSVDTSWNLGLDGAVNALAVSGDTLYIGGKFTQVKSQSRSYLAALLISTGALTGWNPNPNAPINTILASNGSVFVGGDFLWFTQGTTINRDWLAQLDQITGAPSAWNPQLTLAGGIATFSFAQMDGVLYVAGALLKVGTESREGLAAFDEKTGSLLPWNPGALFTTNTGKVFTSVIASNNTIFISGVFNAYNGVTRNNLAALDATGQLLPWNPNADGAVEAMALDGRTMFLGGVFQSVGGAGRPDAAAVDTDGTLRPWNPRPDVQVRLLAAGGGHVLMGGQFTMVNVVPRQFAAAINLTDASPLAWNPSPDGPVTAIKAVGNTIVVGGTFAHIAGMMKPHLAFLDANGNNLFASPEPSGNVFSLGLLNGTVFVGGSFAQVGSSSRNNIAAFDPATGALTGWSSNVNSEVATIAPYGSSIYVAGYFDSAGTAKRNGLAALDATTGLATAWDPQPSNTVYAIAPTANGIFLGGAFTSFGSSATPRQHLAKVNPSNGTLLTWDPGADGNINTLVATGTAVFAGGQFTQIGGIKRNNLSALDPSTGSPTIWEPGISSIGLTTLAWNPGTLLLGGNFYQAGKQGAIGLAGFSGPVFTSVDEAGRPEFIPSTLQLAQNFPNPFNPSTTIRFTLPVAGRAVLKVYDVLGREVRTLVDGFMQEGTHGVTFRAEGLASGVYFYRLQAGTAGMTRKFVLLQ